MMRGPGWADKTSMAKSVGKKKERRTADLSVKDIAREMAISENTVKRLLRVGSLPGYRAGKLWRTTRAWLDAFCERGGVSA